MVRRLKTLFFVLVLGVSVFSGTPLLGADMGMKKNVCPMKCCKKSAKSNKPKKTDSKYLCRVLVCSQNSMPNTTSAPQVNLAPVFVASEKNSLFEILFSTRPKGHVQVINVEPTKFETSQPKYIQHQRILV